MRGKRQGRCARQYAGDFLIGLIVFIFVLGMAVLDSRISSMVSADVPPPRPPYESLASEDLPTSLRAEKVFETITGTKQERADGHGQQTAALDSDISVAPQAPAGPTIVNDINEDQPATAMKLASNLEGAGPGKASSLKTDSTARSWALVVMALIFAAMLAMTLGLWRHLHLTTAKQNRSRRLR